MQSYRIIHGWAEGPWHSKLFRLCLGTYHYSPAPSAAEADIIIAHSGGCYLLPKTNEHQVVVLIDPPFWPHKALLTRFAQKIYRDFQARSREKHFAYWLEKITLNWFYLVKNTGRSITIVRCAKRNRLPISNIKNLVIVRNSDDAFLTPQLNDLPENVQYFTLPGEHDDLWVNPEPYVAILNEVSRGVK